MAKHRVNWHLDMGAKQHREGDEIELDAELAAKLVPLGVVTPLAEEESSDGKVLTPAQLAKLTKNELVAYAKETFGKELDGSVLTKDAMLAEIATLAAEAEAAK